jgi:hypothetical protein
LFGPSDEKLGFDYQEVNTEITGCTGFGTKTLMSAASNSIQSFRIPLQEEGRLLTGGLHRITVVKASSVKSKK